MQSPLREALTSEDYPIISSSMRRKNTDSESLRKLIKLVYLGLVVLLSGWFSPVGATVVNLSFDEGHTIYEVAPDTRLSIAELSRLSPAENVSISSSAAHQFQRTEQQTHAWILVKTSSEDPTKKDAWKVLGDEKWGKNNQGVLGTDLVNAWDILRKNGRTDLKTDIPPLEALNKIRKHSRLSELGLTDDMLGKIQGIDNVSYVQMLDEVEKAMDALSANKTKDFSKIIQNGEKRGLVNTDPTNGIYDRRHSWLTLKVIQDNSDFLKKADAIEFEASLETIDGIPQSVPDIKLTISEGGINKLKIGEVYAGTAGAKSNLASQSLTYFNAVSDIHDLRFFRRINVADKTVAKNAVIDSWKNGVTNNQKVRELFTDYYNRINDADLDITFTPPKRSL